MAFLPTVRLTAGIGLVVALAAPLAAAGPAGPEVLEVVRQQLPPRMEAGQSLTVPLTLANRSDRIWDPAAHFHVGAHWFGLDGEVVRWDGPRTGLPHPVPAGAEVDLQARLEPPSVIGTYLVQWDVVQEGVAWLSERAATPPPRFAVEVVPRRPADAFSVLESSLQGRLWAGRRTIVHLRLRNDGSRTWDPTAGFNVSYHWQTDDGADLIFEGERTPLPHRVAPGDTVDIGVRLPVPEVPGRYRLEWDMVEEGVTWFSQSDPTPEPAVAVHVVAPPPLAALAFVAALLLAALVWTARRRGWSGWPVRALALADLGWVAISLLVKEPVILHLARRMPEPGQLWLVGAGVALVLLALLALPLRLRPAAAWGVAALAGLVVLADSVYLRYFGDVLSLAAARGAGQVPQVASSIRELLAPRDLWLLADLLPGAVLAVGVVRLARRTTVLRRRWVAAALLVVVGGGGIVAGRVVRAAPERFVQVFENLTVVQQVGLYNYHLLDALWQAAARFRPPLDDAELSRVRGWLAARAPLRAGAGPDFAAAHGRNLLMIQVESLQRFVVGLRVEGQEITPFLDRWRRQGLWFPRVNDQTDEGRTSDGELATQTSLLPLAHGAAVFRYPDNHFASIARVLAAHGYHTLSAVPFPGSFWNRRLTHPAWGFDTNLFDEAFAPGERIGWGLNDRAFLEQMAPRLETLPEPFCAWLITLSLHYPFEGFPDHLKELHLGRWEGTELGNYLHTMHYLDAALAGLVSELARSGLAERTLIAVWGDHDAGFGWSPRLEPLLGIRHDEVDWILEDRVPLLVVAPGADELMREVDVEAGQTDVAPTLLALLGVDPAPYAFVGRNLLGAPGDGPVVEPGDLWVDGSHLYVSRGAAFAEGACYDVARRAPVALEACRAADAVAREERTMAGLILSYDLQERLSTGPLDGGAP